MTAEEQRLPDQLAYMCVEVGHGRARTGERFGRLVELAQRECRPPLDEKACRVARFPARPGSGSGLFRLSRGQEGDRCLPRSSRCRILNRSRGRHQGSDPKEVPHVNIDSCIGALP
jgi:hypothetical protein